ncbi:MAG: rod shape-determining protein [Desulfobacterales bacterium]
MGNRFLSIFSNDLAIDLGTANTLVYKKRKGIVLNESSVVALRTDRVNGHRVLAVGQEARQMMGKTPGNVITIRPMRDGVIADFEATGVMLRQFIRRVRSRMSLFKPRMIIAVPSGISSVERRAVRESAEMSGAGTVFLIEEPMAAAVGADMPVSEPTCNMIADIGGGTTEVAVISLGGIVFGLSIKVAGDKMDEAIIRHVKKQYNFLIGERTAEEVKISIGNACPDSRNSERIEVKGWEVVSGKPMILLLTDMEVREAISDHLKAIGDAIKTVLEKIPQELAAHVLDTGIVLTGGVALLKNLDKYLARETGLPVRVAEDPLTTVVRGSGKILDNRHLFKKILSP